MADNFYFNGEEKRELEVVKLEAKILEETPYFFEAIDTIYNWVLVLNEALQVVAYNKKFKEDLGIKIENVQGNRLGEILECVHSKENESGCGTSRYCIFCGAVQSMIKGNNNISNTNECRITTKDGDVLSAKDFKITSTPIEIENNKFIIFNVQDIQKEQSDFIFNQLIGSRLFLNDDENMDILENAQELKYQINILDSLNPNTKYLFNENKMKYFILDVEQGKIKVEKVKARVDDLLVEIIQQFKLNIISKDKRIYFEKPEKISIVSTDENLFRIAVSIMIENALEATEPMGSIEVFCMENQDDIEIIVRNHAILEKEEILKLYQKFYSSKEYGRGLGTYVLRIISDQYLEAKTYAESDDENGTSFYFIIPKNI